jgi:hypothetical protein
MRSEAMRTIRSGVPFTLEFVTANRRTGKGGKLIKVKDWVKVSGEPAIEKQPGKTATVKESANHKDPNHHIHKTFNIYNPANPKLPPMKVHYRLMLTFDNKKIING